MKSRPIILLLFALLLASSVALAPAKAAKLPAKPNIIIILADDLGVGDLELCRGDENQDAEH